MTTFQLAAIKEHLGKASMVLAACAHNNVAPAMVGRRTVSEEAAGRARSICRNVF